MPGWNIHLEAGNRLANKLKFSAPKRKEFLLGCLLPDINNGYIILDNKQTTFALGKAVQNCHVHKNKILKFYPILDK